MGPQRCVTIDEGIRLSDQLRSAASFGGPALPRRRRFRTKTAEDLHDLLERPLDYGGGGRAWFEQRSCSQQSARIGAYLSSAGLTAVSAALVAKAEAKRAEDKRAEAKRKRATT